MKAALLAICQTGTYFHNKKRRGTVLAIYDLETFSRKKSGDTARDCQFGTCFDNEEVRVHCLRFVNAEHTFTTVRVRGHCLLFMISRHSLETDKGGHCEL